MTEFVTLECEASTWRKRDCRTNKDKNQRMAFAHWNVSESSTKVGMDAKERRKTKDESEINNMKVQVSNLINMDHPPQNDSLNQIK